MKRKRVAVVMAVLALAAMVIYRFTLGRPARDADTIRVSGNVEITDAQVSLKIPGRMLAREVSEGDAVQAGQLVARLDSTELAQEVSLRRAEVAAAALAELEAGSRAEAAARQGRSQLDELLAGSRDQEVAAAEASVRWAAAEQERSRAEFERQARLYRTEVISSREYEAAQAADATATAQLQEAEEHFKLPQVTRRSNSDLPRLCSSS